PRFSRRASLFRDGYVDSLGVVELLAFINDDFGVEVPDEALVPDNFETIDDIARVIHGLVNGRREHGLTEAPLPPPPGAPRRESSRAGGPGSSARALFHARRNELHSVESVLDRREQHLAVGPLAVPAGALAV